MYKIEDFIILKEIGKGSFGKILKVRYKADGLIYAIKSLKTIDTKKKILKYIGEEVLISQMLQYKNIIKCFGSFNDAENIYLLFEYTEFGDLTTLITPINEYDTKKIIISILKALRYCHKLKICHRDIKPANILIFEENKKITYKLADWGLSTMTTALCAKGDCGTPNYMAPEIWQNSNKYKCDKTDIWAIGILIVYCLTSNIPFSGKTRGEVGYKIVYKKPNLQGLTNDQKKFVKKFLEKDPEKRITIEEALSDDWFLDLNNNIDLTKNIIDLS